VRDNGSITMSACEFHDTEFALHDRRLFEIVEQAYRKLEKVLIFARSAERAEAIDRFLWVLKQEAFIPHKVLAGQEDDCEVPVASSPRKSIRSARRSSSPMVTAVLSSRRFDSIHEFVIDHLRTAGGLQKPLPRVSRSEIPVEYSK